MATPHMQRSPRQEQLRLTRHEQQRLTRCTVTLFTTECHMPVTQPTTSATGLCFSRRARGTAHTARGTPARLTCVCRATPEGGLEPRAGPVAAKPMRASCAKEGGPVPGAASGLGPSACAPSRFSSSEAWTNGSRGR